MTDLAHTDIDWEYAGGNGADYKTVLNSERTSEIITFPLLLTSIRSAIGPDKILAIAVPAKKGDMIAYTAETAPAIEAAVDHINIMSYDLMSRRDTVNKHHTGVAGSLEAVGNYLALRFFSQEAASWICILEMVHQEANSTCGANALGCQAVVMENAEGSDNDKSGALAFEPANMVFTSPPTNLSFSPDGSCGTSSAGPYMCEKPYCSGNGYCGSDPAYCGGGCQVGYGNCTGPNINVSWQKALASPLDDQVGGGRYYWDSEINLFWTWDSPEFVGQKFEKIVTERGLGGVFAWSLGRILMMGSRWLPFRRGQER
jgi:chitinase